MALAQPGIAATKIQGGIDLPNRACGPVIKSRLLKRPPGLWAKPGWSIILQGPPRIREGLGRRRNAVVESKTFIRQRPPGGHGKMGIPCFRREARKKQFANLSPQRDRAVNKSSPTNQGRHKSTCSLPRRKVRKPGFHGNLRLRQPTLARSSRGLSCVIRG